MGARWPEYAVQKLVNHGHLFREIPDYTLSQVTMLLDAIDREEAGVRSAFLMDLGVTVSGVLGGSDGFSDHLDKMIEKQTD